MKVGDDLDQVVSEEEHAATMHALAGRLEQAREAGFPAVCIECFCGVDTNGRGDHEEHCSFREWSNAEVLASLFHAAYERLAPQYGYRTREESAVAWEDVPAANRELMIATAGEVIEGILRADETRPLRHRITAQYEARARGGE